MTRDDITTQEGDHERQARELAQLRGLLYDTLLDEEKVYSEEEVAIILGMPVGEVGAELARVDPSTGASGSRYGVRRRVQERVAPGRLIQPGARADEPSRVVRPASP